MAVQGTIYALNVSPGGVPKWPIDEAHVTAHGISGDRQRDLRVHGGPRRALCLYSLDLIEALAEQGHPIEAGSAGENVTVSGIPWGRMLPGSRLRLGEDVLIEITEYTAPCSNVAWCFFDGDFNRMNHRVLPGWSRVYAKVLSEGVLHPGDPIELIEETAADRVARTQPPAVRWTLPGR